ncbi:MAG: DUF4091 domain-containing protein [Chloroflexota bacterium]|nr:DUF4091 domain-containing protein [Chloroflexota bacterium]
MKIQPIFRLSISMILLCSVFTPLKAPSVLADSTDAWWNTDWPYRVPVTVEGSRVNSVNLDFTQLFDNLGLQDALLDLRSIRVVPYLAGIPIPYEETYSTLFLDADSLNSPDPYWSVEESTELALDEIRFSQGTASIHSHTVIDEGSNAETGFTYAFAESVDWSDYETLLYDVWPEVNASAVDQSSDLYQFELGGLFCKGITEINGPAIAIDDWNSVSVSLKPYGNCEEQNLTNLTSLRWFVKVNRPTDIPGYFDPGDELDLWLDNFRLVDQNGSGEIRWNAQEDIDKYYIYFDTLDHEGHPPATTIEISETTISFTADEVEAGGYFHKILGASTGELAIWNAPLTENITQTQQAPTTTSPLLIYAARGEFEPIQLVVQSPITQSLIVSTTPLTHTDGITNIPAENIDLFRVDYVPIAKISGYFGRIGPWPDPLYPVSLGETIEFPANKNQPLWFRIEVPNSARPGMYSGTIMIDTATVPITLQVWGFALPTHPQLESKFGFDWDTVSEEYKATVVGEPQSCYGDFINAVNATFEDYRLTPSADDDYGPPEDVELYWLTSYESEIAHTLQTTYGKQVWWQSTHIFDPPVMYPQIIDELPLANPSVIDRPGTDARILPKLAWLDRVDGYYYPQTADWDEYPWETPFSNGVSNGDGYFFYPPKDETIAFDPCDPDSNRLVPSIRLELLREGMEDYTYLWLLNGGKPAIGEENQADLLLQEIIASRTAFSRVPTAWDPLRIEIANLIEAKQTYTFLPLLIR